MTEILTIGDEPGLPSRGATSNLGITRRYRAEQRFRYYGLSAILLTAAFLAVLLADIVSRGLPAFFHHELTLDVSIPSDILPPGSAVSQDGLRSVDFTKLVRESLRKLFPSVAGRKQRRVLDELLSSGAGDELRHRLLADPSLIGTTVLLPVILSDEADLHLKSGVRDVDRLASAGTATLAVRGEHLTVNSSGNDFAPAFESVRAAIAGQLDQVTAEFGRVEGLLAGTTSSENRQSLERTLATLKSRIDAYKARLAAASSGLDLDDTVPSLLVSIDGGILKAERVTPSTAVGSALVPLGSTASAPAGGWQMLLIMRPESNRTASDQEVAWLEQLGGEGRISRSFNWLFFTAGDSREPELAGIRGALIGSILTLLITLVLCLPIGVAAAIYLEEFAPKNRLTDLIEVNINNLAAVPSIVFGLLGLAVFLNFFGLPRSAPVVGGLVLALLVLPTIIIASRAALKAVPPSIKEAALGVGASHQQAIFHHVLPLALPGIMTGTIIGMAHALGETAPLLMIGMVAFIVEIPDGFTSAATVLPVQIYLWSDLPELGFQSKTAGAIIVLLCVLFVMNGAAIYLRRKFERRW
jgi:phosphate transport system permease protein